MKPMHLFRFECVSGKATAALAPAPSSVLSVKMSCPTVPCHGSLHQLFVFPISSNIAFCAPRLRTMVAGKGGVGKTILFYKDATALCDDGILHATLLYVLAGSKDADWSRNSSASASGYSVPWLHDLACLYTC